MTRSQQMQSNLTKAECLDDFVEVAKEGIRQQGNLETLLGRMLAQWDSRQEMDNKQILASICLSMGVK